MAESKAVTVNDEPEESAYSTLFLKGQYMTERMYRLLMYYFESANDLELVPLVRESLEQVKEMKKEDFESFPKDSFLENNYYKFKSSGILRKKLGHRILGALVEGRATDKKECLEVITEFLCKKRWSEVDAANK